MVLSQFLLFLAVDIITIKLARNAKSKCAMFYNWKEIVIQDIKKVSKSLPNKFPSSQVLDAWGH